MAGFVINSQTEDVEGKPRTLNVFLTCEVFKVIKQKNQWCVWNICAMPQTKIVVYIIYSHT